MPPSSSSRRSNTPGSTTSPTRTCRPPSADPAGPARTIDCYDRDQGGRNMLLDDKVCIVSGIGPGLGRQLALACAREGASVVLGARTEASLVSVAAECEALGARTAYSVTDICDKGQCERLVQTAI